MKNKKNMIDLLKEDAQKIEIPDSIKPDMVRKTLKEHQSVKKKETRLTYSKALAAAAGICIVICAAAMAGQIGRLKKELKDIENVAVSESSAEAAAEADSRGNGLFSSVTYEEIYASMEKSWETSYRSNTVTTDGFDGIAVYDTVAEEVKEDSAECTSDSAFGSTNVQTAGVDEGDIVKNDGRYLYQIVSVECDDTEKTAIQIVDTQDGLKELARVADFDSVDEFYVWEDVLVVIESKYLDYDINTGTYSAVDCYYDVYSYQNCYHQISFYDLTDRSQPEKLKTFTLQGMYSSSRIADGYFYGFSRYYASAGEGESDYDAYIPNLDGMRLPADNIFLPEDGNGTSYLVIVSIDLRDPADFVQTMGIISESDMYYVSGSSIYVTDATGIENETGWTSPKTKLFRFSYGNGVFELQAEGEIKGSLNDTFSMDEYDGYLRVVTTVNEYNLEIWKDDRTGEIIGSEIVENQQSNALYILDKDLNLAGQIEGLAENEQIYSARFMGKTGYFVTFRQTDPLFTVDLSNPADPKVLSELKVSGFSEYLHIYGDGRLFGLGMEADETTGWQEGIKLSMFDISDSVDVQEITRLHLEEYYYSEALYNHHAILINPEKNLIGFEAEGSDEEDYWIEYLVFSYENDTFTEKLKLDITNEGGRYYSTRGTFIGDTFYLLRGNGTVESYDLNTGNALETLD